MTDNEKRAHDLALLILPKAMKACDWEPYYFTDDGEGQMHYQVVPTYLELYNEILTEINEAFS